ncbi:hypothetical protein TNCV_377531 [Trichonephila clavipes]|nr:hypothetical protein TNCV_377531 [Trichonephila clavipes]
MDNFFNHITNFTILFSLARDEWTTFENRITPGSDKRYGCFLALTTDLGREDNVEVRAPTGCLKISFIKFKDIAKCRNMHLIEETSPVHARTKS